MTTLVEFAEELRARRTGNGVLLTTFAGWLNVSKATLSRWERHLCTPPDDALKNWARLLELPVPDGVHGRLPPACGTTGGYRRHLDLAEETCPECRAANTAYHVGYEARRSS